MSKIEFIRKRKTFLLYCVYGFLATALETGLYSLFFIVLEFSNSVSTLVSWFLTVVFAFFTNKLFVYRSRDWSAGVFFGELAAFFSARLTTGVFNFVLMLVTVDYLGLDGVVMKIISALFVGAANYLIGLLVIFRRKGRESELEKNEY